ncbi:MAG: response regulator [bacterium]|nr:response regulator [bacterium]
MAKILIVDDSRTSRKFLRNILEENHHEIIGEAKNGLEAIEKYKELRPDLTTMDITMPELDGIGALKEIMEFDQHAKVIMVTAAGQKNKIVEAVKYGAIDYVTKPFDPEKIEASIEKSL